MNIFELLLLALAFFSLLVVGRLAGLVLTGRGKSAFRLFRRYSVCVVAYAALVCVSSGMMPRRELSLGENLCFDDWCLRIDRYELSEDRCRVFGAISSQAGRVTQREFGIVIYLVDANGLRVDAAALDNDVPFAVQLAPRETVDFSRSFPLNPGQIPQEIVVTHERGFPIEWLIIGQGPFQKPPRIQLRSQGIAEPGRSPAARISRHGNLH